MGYFKKNYLVFLFFAVSAAFFVYGKDAWAAPTPVNVPVLVLKYFPRDPKAPLKINRAIVGNDVPEGTTISSLRQKVNGLTSQLVSGLGSASAFHKYSVATASPALKYTVVDTKEFLRPILRTTNSDWGFEADHLNELKNLNICNWVKNFGVKEVWIWMYHNTPSMDANRYYVMPVESNMSGPYGDISNSYRRPDDLPLCGKTYTVYEYNYGRGYGEAVEDHTHQMESVFGYADSATWGKFVGNSYAPFACGWTHCPPNVMSDCNNHQYDWANEAVVPSYCENWNKSATGLVKDVSCHTWAGATCGSDSGDKFKVWWMQNIPSKWWVWIGDFDKAKKSGAGLD